MEVQQSHHSINEPSQQLWQITLMQAPLSQDRQDYLYGSVT
ncbi:hypothetical protein CHCC14435_0585 [Bacillus licheniformis]|nr:hypothetical protein CHCC15543_0493 [Bacillus licheniformis]TWM67217.1 hypothetical protein CHCC14810_2457 [Bacillus licheniformis]TWN53585.1 hypothetical protein CHCC14435_0585 [Bacillus licheniformis]